MVRSLPSNSLVLFPLVCIVVGTLVVGWIHGATVAAQFHFAFDWGVLEVSLFDPAVPDAGSFNFFLPMFGSQLSLVSPSMKSLIYPDSSLLKHLAVF
jgi:hypothetical protein